MTTPFPGMDPFLEGPAYWRDFHQRFITYWCDWLADQVPDAYEVRIDERENGVDEKPEAFLRVMHRPDSSLITVLELLSPSNKERKGRLTYLEKRNELLRDTVHLVELDLLLGGVRVPIKGKLPPGDYHVYVARGDRRPECEVYSWFLTEPLPRIRIPLKAPDPDVVFDLPGLFAEAYRRGRYTRSLSYDDPPPVPLPPAHARWVAEQLTRWRKERSQ